LLTSIQEKPFQLSPLGEIKVGDRPAVGVRGIHKDHKDVGLYFDKETGLPVKSEVRLKTPDGKEVMIEYRYVDYKDMDGLKHPTKIVVKADDKEFTLEVSEVKAEGTVDESVF